MKNIKNDFPFFENNPGLIYCDSAATTQKPRAVIERMCHFYTHENAPVHRGLYRLAEQATEHYEAVRAQVRDFIGAESSSEIIFTANATAGINIVAHAWAKKILKPGDEIVFSELEHHANLVPWLVVAEETGAMVRYIPVRPDGDLDYTQLSAIITEKTKIVAVTARSNVTGAEVDLSILTQRTHAVGAALLVDACQSALRSKIDVKASNFDFLVFSGHKILGPAGIGILFARKKFHAQMGAFQSGGGAVLSVDYDRFEMRDVPHRFEAGTPDVAAVLGLGTAITYITTTLGQDVLRKHEAALCRQLIEGLEPLKRVRILGPVEQLKQRGHLVSFVIDGIHAYDIATYFDLQGVAVRAGHHCVQPLHKKLGVVASVRISFCCYNTSDDVRKILDLIKALVSQSHPMH